MTDPDDRRRRIETAEELLGARLPPLCRSALIADGQASFDLGDGQFLDLWLAPEGQGAHIFAHCDGVPITEMGGWDDYAENWHLQENAFLAAFNGCGDYFLLLPDEAGIARQVVFADHEIGALNVICADLEAGGLAASPQRRDARAALLAQAHLQVPRAGRRSNPEPGEKAPGPDRLRCIWPAFTGALCAAGIVTVVSIFLGVLLAYAWRRKDPANHRHYSRQIRYFWRLAAAWAVGFALLVLAVLLKSLAAGPTPGHVTVIFGIGLLIAGLGQIWFTAITLFQSLRLTWWPGSA